MSEPELQISVETSLAETWDGLNEDPPTFADVFNDALERVAYDVRDELDDQARCQKVDTCQAQAMIKRALADALMTCPARGLDDRGRDRALIAEGHDAEPWECAHQAHPNSSGHHADDAAAAEGPIEWEGS